MSRLLISVWIILFATTEVFAQSSSLEAGLYNRQIDDGVHLLTIADTLSGSNIENHINAPYNEPSICGGIRGRIDITLNFSAPKDYQMGSPLTGTGTCTITDFNPKPGCQIKCTVEPQQEGFRQTDAETIVLTASSGSLTFKRIRGQPRIIEIVIKDMPR